MSVKQDSHRFSITNCLRGLTLIAQWWKLIHLGIQLLIFSKISLNNTDQNIEFISERQIGKEQFSDPKRVFDSIIFINQSAFLPFFVKQSASCLCVGTHFIESIIFISNNSFILAIVLLNILSLSHVQFYSQKPEIFFHYRFVWFLIRLVAFIIFRSPGSTER